jgi:hypothetical protein
MQLGASFSHPHLRYLKLKPLTAIESFKSLGLNWIRLGCYWSDIEEKKGEFNFSELDPLVEYCNKNKIKIVMTVGMKASRWPEYYIPDWLNFEGEKYHQIKKSDKKLHENTLRFIEKCIKRYKNYSSIKVWQIENEPLDPSGPLSFSISKDFLQDEIDLVRKIGNDKKIMINLWGNETLVRGTFLKKLKNVDIYGLDIYPRQYVEEINGYIGPKGGIFPLKLISRYLKRNKSLWISELQAEPWEPDGLVTKRYNPPSFLPEHFEKNLEYSLKLNPEVILLWGFEYWLWRKEKKKDDRYWKEAKKIINNYS